MTLALAARDAGWTLEALMEEVTHSHDEDEPDDVLVRSWRDHKKYVCGVCERFMRIDNREAVEDHIESEH